MLVPIQENSSEVSNIIRLSYNLIESSVVLEFLWYHPKQKKAENIWQCSLREIYYNVFSLLQKGLIHMQCTSTLYFTFPLRNIHMYSLSQEYTVAAVRFMSLWSNLKECDPETKLNIKPGGAVKQQGFAD